MDWARILAFVTGMVDQELLARKRATSLRRVPTRRSASCLRTRRKLHLGQRGHGGGIVRIGEVGHTRRACDRLA